jgi:hypothetical protein
MIRSSILVTLLASFALSACVSTGGGFAASDSKARKDMVDAIALEPKGTYYVGRRYYKVDYKFWGYVRKSGEPWSSARLVMMNENSKLAPDREQGHIGIDNNYEYKLLGDFSSDEVYEPASNRKYPEFRLKGTELLTTTPGPIYHDPKATNPEWRVIPTPY